MGNVLAPVDELARFQNQRIPEFMRAIERLVEADLNPTKRLAALNNMADLLAATQGIADLMGRRRLLLEIDARKTKLAKFSLTEQPIIPKVTFNEAVENMIQRDPRLAVGAEEVRQLYRRENFFALAKSTEIIITKRVQKIIAEAIRTGQPENKTLASIQRQSEDFNRAYAQVVYRTNLTSAYSRGRKAQAKDPDVRDFVKAFRFTTAGDVDVRKNHAAADGMIAGQDDPVWETMTPPIGYACRCSLDFITTDELKRKGLLLRSGEVRRATIPRGAHRDPGFVAMGDLR